MNVSRRSFLAGSGLVIGVAISPKAFAQALLQGDPADVQGPHKDLNAFVRVAPDGTVTILSKHLEMGQGPYTGLATLVAEELDADWDQMRTAAAPANDDIYKNLALGLQATGGSTSIANSYDQLRRAGATARAMLVAAAADSWGVPASQIDVKKGVVSHAASGRRTDFGALADKAATMRPPAEPKLKDRADFVLIGTDTPRLDTVEKSTGKAVFTLDVMADDMLIAMVAHSDRFGATVKSFDDTNARKIPGVVDIKQVPQGVAVYAENTWAALRGRAALEIEWDLSKAERRSSAAIVDDYRARFGDAGIEASSKGDTGRAFSGDGITTHEVELVFPFLAHAPMEPLDAVLMRNADGGIDCYAGSQFPGQDKAAIAKVCGVDPAKVTVNVQLAGGSFGRRAQFGSPYMREAAEVFKASGMNRPVKHVWTREDDIRGGFYRPIYVHRLRGALDADGNIVAWDQKIAGQSILGKKKGEADRTSLEGASDLPYAIPNIRVEGYNTDVGVPILWWRSVGHTHTGFAVETFIDELLEKAGADPVEGRLALLKDHPRESGVLRKAAELADAAGKAPEGRARGVAVHKSFNTYVAEIAEVSIGESGVPRVHNVWVAVDCGVAVNPNIVRAQMEGGVGFGVGAILFDEITLGNDGKVQQSNFHDYRSLRIDEMPHVEVAVISSTEAPTGVGEPGVPPIGPAVANAWRRLTGRPVRSLPIVNSGMS